MTAFWGRAAKARRFVAHEAEEIARERPVLGLRRAVARRVLVNLELGDAPGRLAALERRADELVAADAGAYGHLAAHEDALRHLRTAQAEERQEARRLEDIVATTAWVESLPPSPTLVSVVLPTRNRPELVGAAIASVLRQQHTALELLVVDDGGEDETVALLAAVDDPRVRVLRRDESPGGSAARNHALRHASGELITYLDDDNMMGPAWLRAVVWAFDAHPEADVAYGAFVTDMEQPGLPEPWIRLTPWSRSRLAVENLVDQNVLAHRAGLPEATFDETLAFGSDWDLIDRLTADKDPIRIPVLAATYRTKVPGRMTDQSHARHGWAQVQQRMLRRRPLRILGVNAMFPLITETYIHDELHALEQLGAQLAWYCANRSPSPMEVTQPVYHDLDRAIAEFRPDVLFLHWLDFANGELERLEALGIPFGVRSHSFEARDELAAPLRDHPLCAGVWSYPSTGHARLGTNTLVPIFSSAGRAPASWDEPDTITSISAGLPKKNFPLLLEAMGKLPGVRRTVVTGVTVGHEALPGEVALLARELADPPLLQVNLTREQALDLYARTALLVYTLVPEAEFGMPMSIVEAMTAGCCVVVPDRPECVEFAGPNARTYASAHDIARHAREVLAGGAAITAERAANRAYALERFSAPGLGERFLGELLTGLDRVRASRAGLPDPGAYETPATALT